MSRAEENKHKVNTVSPEGRRWTLFTGNIRNLVSRVCSQKTKILSSPATAKTVYDRDAAGGRALQSINLAQMNNIVGERNGEAQNYNGGRAAHIGGANNIRSLRRKKKWETAANTRRIWCGAP
ncbi:hypothetical protein QQF64_019833 [Cirrhinus molitorella]|uniref:Uncharacterized protein n=1 Tax=Cirrhinus molitorella TaxID=172907 RepID=A0ABR3LGK3_9TELE